ncbi:MAG: hypothetical protein ACRD4C_07815, partial [Candidatus Acidiferrales bacterium]
FEAMNGFHIALVGVSGRWNAHVLALAESFGEIAFKLATVVGLPDQIAQRDAVAIQMLLDAGGEDGAGRGAFVDLMPDRAKLLQRLRKVFENPRGIIR